MKKYFLPLLLASKFLFSQVETIDSNLQVIPPVTQEAYTAFVKDLSTADMQWKNEKKEEALVSYTTLLENSTNPLFTIALNFRKGILESQMGREEDATTSFRSALNRILTFGEFAMDDKLSDEKTLGDHYTSTLMGMIRTPESVRHCPKSICLCPESLCRCPETVCP